MSLDAAHLGRDEVLLPTSVGLLYWQAAKPGLSHIADLVNKSRVCVGYGAVALVAVKWNLET